MTMPKSYITKRGANKQKEVLLTVGEVAEVLRVHPNTVRVWADHGLLPVYRIGTRGDRRFKLSDLDSFMRRSLQTRYSARGT